MPSRWLHRSSRLDIQPMTLRNESTPVLQSAHKLRNGIGFWLLGLANNFPFAVMLSAAYDILDRHGVTLGTGIVLLADIIPDLIIKLLFPFALTRISFNVRVILCVCLSAASFLIVAFSESTWLSLIGVACGSAASGLGEITFLALTAYFSNETISFWSSGTGAAGLLGSLSYLLFTMFVSPETALLFMLFCPLVLFISFFVILERSDSNSPKSNDDTDDRILDERVLDDQLISESNFRSEDSTPSQQDPEQAERQLLPDAKPTRSFITQFKQVPPLLIFIVPIMLGYFAAYLINQGIYENVYWENEFINKATQYRVYQTLYRFGVFVARSSRGIIHIHRVWIPASLECVNVLVMALDARFKFLPSIWIWFVLIVYEGLLAGATYVNGFVQVSAASPREHAEFLMGVAALGGSIGIATAGGIAVAVDQVLSNVGGR